MSTRIPRGRGAVGRRGAVWVAVAAAAPLPAWGTSDFWNIAGNGNWNAGGNWTTGVPTAGQDVFITNAGSKTVTYVDPGFTNSFLSLTLDSATGINTLSQSQDLLSVGTETVGGTGRGAYTINGGSNTVGVLQIGNSGSGTYTVNGGSNTVSSLLIGNAVSGSGTYTLTGSGLLTISTLVELGVNGTGRFAQTGGTVNASSAVLLIGFASNSVGLYTQSGGSLVSGTVTLGRTNSASGTFNQSGGTHSISGTLIAGDAASTTAGAYNMSNGAALTVTRRATFGSNGAGTFLQTGGSSTFNGGLTLADNSGSRGTATLGGGTLNVGAAAEIVGDNGTGVFNHSGGTHTVAGTFILGNDFSGRGTYAMSNGAVLTVNGAATFGNTGTASFTQTGGSSTFNGGLTIADNSIGGGTVTLSGGVFAVTGTNLSETIGGGFNPGGTFNQSGGTHNISGNLLIATSGGGGHYAMSNGATLTVGGVTLIGGTFANAAFNQTGGSADLHSLSVNNGTATLSGGTLIASNGVNLGSFNGTGVINQSGGNLSAGGLQFGFISAEFGIYNLSGGTLSTTAEFIDFGTFNHSGGANAIAGALRLGSSTDSNNAYNMSNGASLSSKQIIVGASSNGTFRQTGGVNSVTATGGSPGLTLGSFSSGAGTYTLSGGILSMPNAAEIIGAQARGTYTQTDGTNTCFALSIGDAVSGTNIGSGTVNLAGGVLNALAQVSVGNFGFGTLNHSDGSLNTTSLYVGSFSVNRLSSYAMTNGTLAVSALTYFGYHGMGAFNQSGGSSSLGSALFISFGTGGNGTVNLSGGFLTAGSMVNNGAFNQSGGSLSSLGAVSGSGTMTIGNSSGTTARANVTRFDQGAITIKSTGSLVVATNAVRFTNSVGSLTITGNGLLDLGNHALLLDNLATPEVSVRAYLHNAYNADATGIGDWLGAGGITSSDAIKAHNTLTGNFNISVGYVNGAYANDPLTGGSIPGQESLPTNRILVRPALYGDFNLDGRVDDTDLAIFSGLGQYNQPVDKFGWLGGDLNYDGKVDDTDLQIFSGAGNYNGPPYAIFEIAHGVVTEAAVPEPIGLPVGIGSGLLLLIGRRRRVKSPSGP